jgi:hypothetical protein
MLMLEHMQVHKLEMLDGKVKELMDALERSEREKLQLEDEYTRVNALLTRELMAVTSERDNLRERTEILTSELDATARALQREQAERQVEREEAARRSHLLEEEVAEKNALLTSALKELSDTQTDCGMWKQRAESAEKRYAEEHAARVQAEHERDKQAGIAHMRYCELQIEACARATAERQRDAYQDEARAAGEARDVLQEENRAMMRQLRDAREVVERQVQDAEDKAREVASLFARLLENDARMRAAVKHLRGKEAGVLLQQQARRSRCVREGERACVCLCVCGCEPARPVSGASP